MSKDKLLEALRNHNPEMPDASTVLKDALRQAGKEEKRVIVQETATWCGPCHLLTRFLNANRESGQEHFFKMLNETRKRMTEEEVKAFVEKLKT